MLVRFDVQVCEQGLRIAKGTARAGFRSHEGSPLDSRPAGGPLDADIRLTAITGKLQPQPHTRNAWSLFPWHEFTSILTQPQGLMR